MHKIFLVLSFIIFSCDEEVVIPGCIDKSACNYDSTATKNDGSCQYPAENYNCNGVCIAGIDYCGICGGANSMTPLLAPPEGPDVDCTGLCFGNAIEDECRICDSDSSNDCVQDCAGTWGGSAVEDECGVCNGNGPEENFDCDSNCLFDIDCGDGCSEHVELWGACYNIATTTNLDLYDNELTGEIPPDIGSLTNLTELKLVRNNLTGEIPPEIGRLTNLTLLKLNYNQLTGEIPPEIGTLTNLIMLYLGDNQLTGEIPPEVCSLIESNNLIMSHIIDGNSLINTCE